jgi:hypothetical protein
MGMLEYMEGMLQTSTGWTRYSQGNGAGNLQSTATGMNIVTNKDDMRLDLIARNFAEGFTELFKLMLKLVCQHQDKRVEARIGGKWVDIDPREWRNQFDVEINVGLGVGNKDQKIQHLMALLQHQAQVFPLGVANPQTVYAGSVELAKLQGFKTGDKFFVDPSEGPPPPPKPDPEAAKLQAQMQIEQMKLQAQSQTDQQKAQLTMQVEQQKMQMQAGVDQNRQQVEAGQQQLKLQAEAELNRYKAELDVHKDQVRGQLQMQIEQMKVEAENQRAQLEADTRLKIAGMGQQAKAFAQPSVAVEDWSLPAPTTVGNTAYHDDVAQTPDFAAVLADLQQQFEQLQAAKSAPIKFIRGEDGKAIGFDVGGTVRTINRDENGRMSHVQ